MVRSVPGAVFNLFRNTSSCLSEKIMEGRDLVSEILDRYRMEMNVLADFEMGGSDCMSSVDGVLDVIPALICLTVVSSTIL